MSATPVRTAAPVAGAAAGSETVALLTLRRWLVLVSGSAVVLAAAVFSAYERTRISPLEEWLVVASLAMLAVAWTASGVRPGRLWLAAASTLCLVVTAVLSPPTSSDWLPLVSAASYTAYFVALLLPLRLAWAAVPVGGALLAWAWSGRPANAISGALDLLGGWPSVAQVLLGTAGLVWAWRLLAHEAAAADASVARAEARADESVRREERARVWRAAATRVHESVLNTIRYVMAVPSVDPSRLREQIQIDIVAPEAARRRRPARDLWAELERDRDVADSLVMHPAPDVEVSAEVFEVMRAAVLELVRNARRHGGAGRVDVTLDLPSPGMLEVVVADDGRGLTGSHQPGVGLATVLAAQVGEVGGTWSASASGLGGAEVRFVLPIDETEPPAGPGAFDQGRLLLTAPIAAQSLAAVVFLIALVALGKPQDTLGAVAAAAAIAIAAVVVWRRRRLAPLTALALAVLPVAVPWLLVTSQWRCAETATVAPVLNVSGFALVVLLVWSRPILVGVPAVGAWAIGALLLTVEFPADCREAVSLATLNSLVGLPFILLVTALALRLFRRAEESARAARRRDAVERNRAEAAADLNAALHDAVADAVRTLERVADAGGASRAERSALALADGRIRAAIQLDPAAAGTVALAVRDAVEAAAAQGRPVAVRTLTTSEDRRAVPPGIVDLLGALLAAPGAVPATVQAFTDGEEDHVSLLVTAGALAETGLEPGQVVRHDDVVVEVDDEPAGSGGLLCSVLVSRPVRL